MVPIEYDNDHLWVDIRIRQGESFAWDQPIVNADWAGAYVAQIIAGDVTAVVNVSGTYDAPSTTTTLTMALTEVESAKLPVGGHHFAARHSSGHVYLRGVVRVEEEVVPRG